MSGGPDPTLAKASRTPSAAFAVLNLLLEFGVGQDSGCQRSFVVKIDTVDLDRPCNVLQVLTAEFAARDIDLAFNEVQHMARNADAAAGGDALEPGGDVDTVAEYVAIIFDHVADVDAHPQFDALVGADLCITHSHAALNLDGAFYRIDHARELDEHAVH